MAQLQMLQDYYINDEIEDDMLALDEAEESKGKLFGYPSTI